MEHLFVILTAVLILTTVIIIIALVIRAKTKKLLRTFFNASSIKEAFENNEKDINETPKSVSSMDSLYLSRIKKDFPELNINELKSESERVITDTLNAIEKKDTEALISSKKVNSYIKSKIDDLKDANAIYDHIKVHKTVVSNYEKSSSVATITLASSVEYFYKKDDEVGKKVQTRFKCEYIYIIDSEKVGNVKALGLNCPNCGAPIKTLGHKYCEYCSTGIVDIVKKNWIINNIKEY